MAGEGDSVTFQQQSALTQESASPDKETFPKGGHGATSVREDDTLSEINNSRAELLARVQNLKKDLQDWRGKLDSQVKSYRQELGDLRSTLNSEVEQLRNEFQDLRNSLKKQLDTSSGIVAADNESLVKAEPE